MTTAGHHMLVSFSETRSVNILPNVYFCVSWKKETQPAFGVTSRLVNHSRTLIFVRDIPLINQYEALRWAP